LHETDSDRIAHCGEHHGDLRDDLPRGQRRRRSGQDDDIHGPFEFGEYRGILLLPTGHVPALDDDVPAFHEADSRKRANESEVEDCGSHTGKYVSDSVDLLRRLCLILRPC